jgi:hypothetical protein
MQKKPTPPNLKAQLKLHKVDIPIRPVINNRPALAYKLAKHLASIQNQYIISHNQYVTINSHNLANDLTKLKINENHNMVTFDIKDLYVNIPVTETLNIIKAKLSQHNSVQVAHQMHILLKEVLSQNYFAFQQKIYQPERGIVMGSPISSTIAETFLQNFEDIHIKHLLDTKCIAFYTRYVDDKTRTSSSIIDKYINSIHNNITLNPTYEEHGSNNFLDLTIIRKQKQLEIKSQPAQIQQSTFTLTTP